MLEKCGYQADTVTNGKAVLEALSSTRYDIILMDCQMPEMDGYETTRAIREREQSLDKYGNRESQPVYIIAMTANAMQGDRERCFASGMDDYLSKPVRAPELQAALERWKQAVKFRSRERPFSAAKPTPSPDLNTQVDLSEPRSGLTEQPRPSGLGKLHPNPP
jgi:CheY-like chemotaxis protein